MSPAPKLEVAGQPRWEDPPQRIGEPDLVIYPSGVLRFIDTFVGSPNGGYVNLAGYLPKIHLHITVAHHPRQQHPVRNTPLSSLRPHQGGFFMPPPRASVLLQMTAGNGVSTTEYADPMQPAQARQLSAVAIRAG